MKGPGQEQGGIIGNVVRHYIEETSASIDIDLQANQLADISGLIVAQKGRGGSEVSLAPSTIQENSIAETNPASLDYMDSFVPNKAVEYTVQPGDTISFIASDYGVSVNSILWANNIKDNTVLAPGQIIKIPPISGVVYTVQPGDTLLAVAKKYSAEESRILAFNDLKDAFAWRAGDVIIIPDGTVPAPAPRVVAKSSKTTARVTQSKPFAYLADLGSYFMIPTAGHNWGHIHGRNGVDLANACGTPIYAAADGKAAIVDITGYNGGFGRYIKLVHPNGTETVYAHLNKSHITSGVYVSRGQLIALMGTTGRSTGCHLHFEVHGARNPLAKY